MCFFSGYWWIYYCFYIYIYIYIHILKHIPLYSSNLNFVSSLIHSNTVYPPRTIDATPTFSLHLSLQCIHLLKVHVSRLLTIFVDKGQLGYCIKPVYYFKTSRLQNVNPRNYKCTLHHREMANVDDPTLSSSEYVSETASLSDEYKSEMDKYISAHVEWLKSARNCTINLPETVKVIDCENGTKVYLIGTAHFSEESIQDVKNVNFHIAR